MSENTSCSTFPCNRTEALAMLYMENQDLKGLSPEEIQAMYLEAYYKIQRDYREKSRSGWLKALKESE